MINAVTVTNFKGDSLRMELAHPEKSGMLIYNIEGIGGGKANINTTDLSTGDGARFNSSKLQTRNIILYIKLMAEPTVEECRHTCYYYFGVKKQLRLEFETDTRKVYIDGYVESNEPIIFSAQEYTQISILCPDPLFYEGEYQAKALTGVEEKFEFPFSNESLTENLLEFGEIRFDKRAVFNYEGDADVGVVMTIRFKGKVEKLELFNVNTREHMVISTSKINQLVGSTIRDGDELIISTIRDQKYARFLRNGYYTNVIGAIDKDSDWFQVTAGENIFDFSTEEEGANNIVVTFTYRNSYGGV